MYYYLYDLSYGKYIIYIVLWQIWAYQHDI